MIWLFLTIMSYFNFINIIIEKTKLKYKMSSDFSSATKNRLKAAVSKHHYGNNNNSNHYSSMAINNEISALRTPIYDSIPQ